MRSILIREYVLDDCVFCLKIIEFISIFLLIVTGVKMSKIRRINLYGGPGSGKSTTAAKIFAVLKELSVINNFDVELCTEYVKSWAWEKRMPQGFDQFLICAQQVRKEEIPLRNNVEFVVTDSPILLSCCYAKQQGHAYAEHLFEITKRFEEKYAGLHIFLVRGNKPYVQKGRYQNEQSAIEMDEFILKQISPHIPHLHMIPYNDFPSIMTTIYKEAGIKIA